ncbi:hypothetical protein NPIL_211781 [Nephila pilipes]|uniref:Uncharacterized protein n=1 Tax=Nephila pilipes TaxID=299642 RepID=A0A8X6PFW9_NEPPI|nr:hypothetical protein NPIL_211781 [Nephila pilipes]
MGNEILLPRNTDRMVAKRRSQAIWTPRGKVGIRLPALATKLGGDNFGDFGYKKWHHESSMPQLNVVFSVILKNFPFFSLSSFDSIRFQIVASTDFAQEKNKSIFLKQPSISANCRGVLSADLPIYIKPTSAKSFHMVVKSRKKRAHVTFDTD